MITESASRSRSVYIRVDPWFLSSPSFSVFFVPPWFRQCFVSFVFFVDRVLRRPCSSWTVFFVDDENLSFDEPVDQDRLFRVQVLSAYKPDGQGSVDDIERPMPLVLARIEPQLAAKLKAVRIYG
jgi:hypothetical protein